MPLPLHDRPRPVSLRTLFPQAVFAGSEDIVATDAAEDSRQVMPGSVFAAIPGTRSDGTRFVEDAIARGCRGLLVEAPLAGVSVPQCIVPDVRSAISELCNAVNGDPASRLTIAAVTGTNGKTTITWLIRSLLKAAGQSCGLLGTIKYSDGQYSEPASLTTPDSRTVFRWLRRMVEARCTSAALELSSHALHQRRVAALHLAAAVITNVTQDHFDYHGDFESYLAAKALILNYVRDDGCIAICIDDPGSERLVAPARQTGRRVLTCSSEREASIRAEILNETVRGTRFRLMTPDSAFNVSTRLIGRHNVRNCLCAAAVGYHLGLSDADIRCGLETLLCVPGRLERVSIGQSFEVLVDYAHTDDALQRVVDSLKAVTAGRVLCVFGAGGDRDRSKRPKMARAASRADFVVVTSDNPRTEPPQSIIEEILAGIPFGYASLHVEPDRRRAIDFALGEARPGDCVLIAGKGHETEQIVGTDHLSFDDRLVARELLEARVRTAGRLIEPAS